MDLWIEWGVDLWIEWGISWTCEQETIRIGIVVKWLLKSEPKVDLAVASQRNILITPKNSKNGTRGKKQKTFEPNLNKKLVWGFKPFSFFLGGQLPKTTRKPRYFVAENSQAKAAADAWAAEASEAAKRAKGKVEHGGVGNTVDGRNPAPVDMYNIPLFIGFHTSQVVQDFSHQPYHLMTKVVRYFQKYCWLMERGCIKLTVNNEINYLSTG